MPFFKFAPTADTNATFKRGEIFAAPARLVARFGAPSEADGYKVSGSFTFTDETGNVFTVYDWKCTSLFEDGLEPGEQSPLPTPGEFWAREEKVRFCIGAREAGDVEAFKHWLLAETASEAW